MTADCRGEHSSRREMMPLATVPDLIPFSAGKLVDTAKLNANTVDALRFLVTRPMALLTFSKPPVISSSATAQTLNYDSEVIDNDNMFDGAAPGKLTVQTPGWWFLLHRAYLENGANNKGVRSVWLNTSSGGWTVPHDYAPLAGNQGMMTCSLVYATKGEEIRGGLIQSSGVGLPALGKYGGCLLGAFWLAK